MSILHMNNEQDKLLHAAVLPVFFVLPKTTDAHYLLKQEYTVAVVRCIPSGFSSLS